MMKRENTTNQPNHEVSFHSVENGAQHSLIITLRCLLAERRRKQGEKGERRKVYRWKTSQKTFRERRCFRASQRFSDVLIGSDAGRGPRMEGGWRWMGTDGVGGRMDGVWMQAEQK